MSEKRPDEPPETRGDAPSSGETGSPDAETSRAPTEPEIQSEAQPGTDGGDAGWPPETPAPPPTDDLADTPLPTETPPAPRQRFAAFLAFLALVIAVGAGLLAGYHWWTARESASSRADETAGLAASMRGTSDALRQRADDLEQRLAALEGEVRAGQSRLAGLREQIGRAEDRLSGLAASQQAVAAPERVPAIADAEHLLVIANRELALAGNYRVALAALKEADARLAALDDPSLLGVRQAIGEDVAAVEQAAGDGGEGIALRLGSLIGRVTALPIRASLAPEPEVESTAAEDSGWTRFKRRLLELASGLFRVRRVDQPTAPLMSPEELFLLQANLELDLKAARLAAMAGDPANYTESLRSAREAVTGYFLQEDLAVESFLAALDELAGRDVVPRWPDLSGTVELLRAYTEAPEAP